MNSVTVTANSQRTAIKLLTETDENGNFVNLEVLCFKKISKCNGTIKETLRLKCHTEAQVENFYKTRKPKVAGVDMLKGERKRHNARGHRGTFQRNKGARK